MYNLHLSAEQLEIRDTVRDFVTREIKPAATKADRLDVQDRSLLTAQIDAASQLGLRTLALSEALGGAGADALTSCIVTEELAAGDAAALLTGADMPGRGNPLFQARNLGIGRAAYEAALDYAHLRGQGGRPIIEHQAIATKLAEIAIKLQVSRAAIWQAAWASDHTEAIADRSLSDLPLTTMTQVFVAEMMLKAVKDAAEVFGAMGVMRDMPLQKYVNDARVCLHSGDGNSDAKLRIAEVLAGYRRATNGAMAPAAE